VERAKLLLAQPSLSVAEVAYAVGFSNQAHFATVFHRFEGMAPSSFRERFLETASVPAWYDSCQKSKIFFQIMKDRMQLRSLP
jgi:AraC-like DNA-binding protein